MHKQGDLFVVTSPIYGTEVKIGDYVMYIRTNMTTNGDVYYCLQKDCVIVLNRYESMFSIERLKK